VGLPALVFAEAMPDLAPAICRQRVVIEGTCDTPITEAAIGDYLVGLSEVCAMTILLDPVTHRSDRFGWAGWVHGEGSGAHVYAGDRPVLYFSVDVYTCEVFDMEGAVRFTRRFFDAPRIVARTF
jgi:hypothetical protein